ncbi:preprotein translocase subunit SecA [Leucothrix arctica]|uniref:Protein translocase subunit SecA n=1 Tax=Leucothrix arctica TaxID=1481894 RepID=A0A317CJQ4_9GAMM|nr:preprotein translocase subunit SecA [Leucothrix arctica]PWQ98788.1 preprotein translocase subunit SecA [Leucothrix arctica]
MIGSVARKLFGSRNDRVVKGYAKVVKQVNALEDEYSKLTDEALQAKTVEFRERLEKGETLDSLIPEAFATVREGGKRVMGMRHYDVQMIGGMVLNEGRIAEMRTGEGKTLVATLTAYLNALPGKGVHVITVNDYLASRDAEWMAKLYGFLGLTTGVIIGGIDQTARKAAYACDITYGTNNEFGFDYLRDNMAFSQDERVQRELSYAVIDEVDSILIDEARTPLIISGPSSDSANLYEVIDKIVPQLTPQAKEDEKKPKEDEEGPGDYSVDEKSKQVFLTDAGNERAEELLQEAGILGEGEGLFDSASVSVLHHLNAGLRAHTLFQKNVDYIITDGEIVIVDEFTGRTMPGRRWSEGLHQAIEAKEGVEIKPENQTMASITFQNYFRLYDKLSGMTGTADTEAFELQSIYNLEVIVIPTNKPAARVDENDLVYMSHAEKYDAIVEDIRDAQKRHQPVLVGTASIDSSELLANLLTEAKIEHEVLNAKQHEREAHIIENAGLPGAVTIATNMAGRGTDIVLGGSLEAEMKLVGDDEAKKAELKADWQKRHDAVLAAGGLHIIGTERHESRRVDNQLRGRSGRQGDPGSSRFFLSLEDNLMRIFASDRVKSIMQRLGMEKGQAIEAKIVSKSIENAQRKVEGHNFDIRKNLLEYDDVANDQRKVIYKQRSELLEDEDVQESIEEIRYDVIDDAISRFVPPMSLDEQWDIAGLTASLKEDFDVELDIQGWLDKDDKLHEEPLRERIQESVDKALKDKESLIGAENMRKLERDVMLHVLDEEWKEHLAAMDYLRQSVGLRGYAQKNPKQEYKREAFEMFEDLLVNIKKKVISFLTKIQITQEAQENIAPPEPEATPMEYSHAEASSVLGEEDSQAGSEISDTFKRDNEKVGRNDPCPCGSGKKFKQCHGQLK